MMWPWMENGAYSPVRLIPYSTCSASIFSRNNIFLSHQFSHKSVFSQFQPKFYRHLSYIKQGAITWARCSPYYSVVQIQWAPRVEDEEDSEFSSLPWTAWQAVGGRTTLGVGAVTTVSSLTAQGREKVSPSMLSASPWQAATGGTKLCFLYL